MRKSDSVAQRFWVRIDGNYFKPVERYLTQYDLSIENEHRWKILISTDDAQNSHKFDRTCFWTLRNEIVCKWEGINGRFYPETWSFFFSDAMLIVLEPCSERDCAAIRSIFHANYAGHLWSDVVMRRPIPTCGTTFRVSIDALRQVSTWTAEFDAQSARSVFPVLDDIDDYVVLNIRETTQKQQVDPFCIGAWRQKNTRFGVLEPMDASYCWIDTVCGFWSQLQMNWIIVLKKSTGTFNDIPRWLVHHGAVLTTYPMDIGAGIQNSNVQCALTAPPPITTTTTKNAHLTPVVCHQRLPVGISNAGQMVMDAVERAAKQCAFDNTAQKRRHANDVHSQDDVLSKDTKMIKNSQPDDQKESVALLTKKKCDNTAYDLATIIDPNRKLDFVSFVDDTARDAFVDQCKPAFYNKCGLLLTDKFADLSDTCFVCPGNGSVLCLNSRDLGVFLYGITPSKRDIYGVGRVVQWGYSPTDSSFSIRVQWLRRTTDVAQLKAKRTLDAFFTDRFNWLSLSSYRGKVMLMSATMQKKHIANYVGACLEYVTADNAQQPVRDLSSSHIVDVADLLELYHIPARFIWRSRLGQVLWSVFLAANVVIGRELVSTVFCLKTWTTKTLNPSLAPVFCNACKRRELNVMTIVTFEDGTHANFGLTCVKRMRYIYELGAHLRAFRCATFDPNSVHTFMPQLYALHAIHHRTT